LTLVLILIFPASEKSKGKSKAKSNVKGSGQECPLYTIAPAAVAPGPSYREAKGGDVERGRNHLDLFHPALTLPTQPAPNWPMYL